MAASRSAASFVTEGSPGGVDAWREETRAALRGKGYEAELVRALLLSVETYGDFLAKYDYLFAS